MNNYYKYLKYKNKYLKLKKSGGGKTICNILRNPNLYKTIEYWKRKDPIRLEDLIYLNDDVVKISIKI